MTTTLVLPLSAVKVASANPSTAFGQQAAMPLETGAFILTRAALPPEIPDDANVTSATIAYTQKEVISGSYLMRTKRNSAPFTSKTTWNGKPATVTGAADVTKTSPAAGTLWLVDVTSDVQGFVAGTLVNNGWTISSTSGTRHYWYGATAAANKPTLTIVYETTPDVPSSLSPSGAAVSVAKPWLSFTTVPGMSTVQVQVDPAANPTSPAFDSGEVAATAGRLDLSTTAYAGLSSGSSTSWRARVRTPAGLSAWSDWVTFSRTSKGTVTITSPTGTTADGTPPVTWTFSGTQTAWQVLLLDATGAILSDSGATPGTGTSWTPAKGLTVSGQVGTVVVRVWDNVLRVATTGDPVYASATLATTLTLTGTVPGLDVLNVEQWGVHPAVHLTGTRASGVPDEVAIFRNDTLIARMAGTDAFTGTVFEWVDYTAPPNRLSEYRVAPITTGTGISSAGPTRTIVPRVSGLWLVDPDTGLSAVLWGQDEGTPAFGDIAVTHQPVTGDAPAVRRRLSRPPVSGVATGDVLDALDYLADDTLAALATFSDADQGHVFRYVVGHLNLPVIAGDFNAWPSPMSSVAERIASASFSWWNQDAAATRVDS